MDTGFSFEECVLGDNIKPHRNSAVRVTQNNRVRSGVIGRLMTREHSPRFYARQRNVRIKKTFFSDFFNSNRFVDHLEVRIEAHLRRLYVEVPALAYNGDIFRVGVHKELMISSFSGVAFAHGAAKATFSRFKAQFLPL
jgi:hypothetical protein